jgi:methanogenic corrinoid protein MtbC1
MVRFERAATAKTIQESIQDLNEYEAKRLLDEKLAEGENPQSIVKAIREGINLIIQKYKERAVGIVELAMASRILQECLASLRGWYEGIEVSRIGRVVIGTIQSDREDISHKLMATMLFGAGFEVFSMGGNISAKLFVEKAEEISPEIVVLMGLDEDSIETIRETVDSIRKSERTFKLIVGPRIGMSYIFNIDNDLLRIITADAFANNLAEVGELARGLIEERRSADV